MSRFWRFRLLVLSALLLAGSACVSQGKNTAADDNKTPRIKTGFYVDRGSRGSGVLHLARFLAYSPQLDLVLLDGEDLRAGRLKDVQLLVIPGGSSRLQCESMKPEGMEAIRKFVADGGRYVGICAGFHCTLNRPERLRLLPFEYCEGAGGSQGNLAVDLSEKAGQLLGIKTGRYMVRYSRGPISRPGKQPGEGWGEVLGVYKSTVGPIGRPGGNFFDAPAMIHGGFGKGKVIATSFHPESQESTRCIVQGCIYAVTGVRPVPVYPKKNRRPLRVGYYSGRMGKRWVREMLALDRHPDLDMQFIDLWALNGGMLDHLDAFVIADGAKGFCLSLVKDPLRRVQTRNLLERGGMIFAMGEDAENLPVSDQVKIIPREDTFVQHIFEKP